MTNVFVTGRESGYSGNDAKGPDSNAFADLMDTRFALVPPGNQMASHRLVESMASGAIPVLVDLTEYVRPYHRLIDWASCSLSLKAVGMNRSSIFNQLSIMPAEQLNRMQACVEDAYKTFLSADGAANGLLLSVVDLLSLQQPDLEGLCFSANRTLSLWCAQSPRKSWASIAQLLAASEQQRHEEIDRDDYGRASSSWRAKFFCNGAAPCNVTTVSFQVPCMPCSRFEGLTCNFCIGTRRRKRKNFLNHSH